MLLVSWKSFFPGSLALWAIYPAISPQYIPLKAVVLFLFLQRPTRGVPLRLLRRCGRDYWSEERNGWWPICVERLERSTTRTTSRRDLTSQQPEQGYAAASAHQRPSRGVFAPASRSYSCIE